MGWGGVLLFPDFVYMLIRNLLRDTLSNIMIIHVYIQIDDDREGLGGRCTQGGVGRRLR